MRFHLFLTTVTLNKVSWVNVWKQWSYIFRDSERIKLAWPSLNSFVSNVSFGLAETFVLQLKICHSTVQVLNVATNLPIGTVLIRTIPYLHFRKHFHIFSFATFPRIASASSSVYTEKFSKASNKYTIFSDLLTSFEIRIKRRVTCKVDARDF